MLPIDTIGLALALGIGLLVGLQRERAKGRAERTPGEPGVRTCMLLALAGAVADRLGPSAVLAAGLGVAMLLAMSRWQRHAEGAGPAAEVTMLVTFLLGMLALHARELAGALGVTVAVILASKQRLHVLARQWLSEQELRDLLILATAVFVVLPLLPDRAIDPWQVLNPRKLWLMAVAIMAIASLGYIALRVFGSHFGLGLAGLAGGFVSSTATIASMGERARLSPQLAAAAASAGLMSNVSTVAQLAVVLGAISPSLLRYLALPLVAAGAAALLAALICSRRLLADHDQVRALAGTRPFEPLAAIRFVALLAGVMLLAAMAREWLGAGSMAGVMAFSGLIDVHAAAASAAQLDAVGRIDRHDALIGILAALVANSSLKCIVAFIKGTRPYAWRIAPGIAAMVAAFGLVAWLN
ncbi:MAG TPA: DUF4010 domain-containing protein [Dyella sp.]|uniref:MgtC/SapB family protein n=1 Tax=Dyella sp. TaxID=1869338 RepID=UPI002F9447BA